MLSFKCSEISNKVIFLIQIKTSVYKIDVIRTPHVKTEMELSSVSANLVSRGMDSLATVTDLKRTATYITTEQNKTKKQNKTKQNRIDHDRTGDMRTELGRIDWRGKE